MTAEQEAAWWGSLEGDDIDGNLHGVPPYDVEAAGDRIMMAIATLPEFTVGADMALLDLGCGRGRLTTLIAERGVAPHTLIYAVDIVDYVDSGETIPPGVVPLIGDGRTIPDEVGPINAAWSVTMFQHIPHDAMWDYIVQVYDRLLPGGVFVFTVAVGDEPDAFLRYQIADIGEFADRLGAYFPVVEHVYAPEGHHGWTWVTCWKGRG